MIDQEIIISEIKEKKCITKEKLQLHSDVELTILKKLEEELKINKNRIAKPDYSFVFQKWLELKIKPLIVNNKLFDIYPNYRFIIKESGHNRNYISMDIQLVLYNTIAKYNSGSGSTTIEVGLYELFGNCSSIVINKLNGYLLEDPRRYYDDEDSISMVKKKKLKDIQKFVKDYMNILEFICDKIGNYSTVMYTSSQQETNNILNEYLDANWTNIHNFVNKRNANTINYYIKNL